MKQQQPETISRGIRLHPERWKIFDRLRQKHGSYDKALIAMLSDGTPAPTGRGDGKRGREPLLKPKDRK